MKSFAAAIALVLAALATTNVASIGEGRRAMTTLLLTASP